MRNVSEQYLESVQLHRTQGMRNQMYTEVYFGVIDDTAKKDSTPIISPGTPYSDAGRMYRDITKSDRSYVTWEKDGGFPLSGSAGLIFLPSNGDYVPHTYVSSALSSDVGTYTTSPYLDVSFTQIRSIVGLSFLFDDSVGYAPKTIHVQTFDADGNLLEDELISDNVEFDLKAELTLDNFYRIRIKFTAGQPYQRVRLKNITFGIGYVFTSAEMISTKFTRTVHPLALTNPVNNLQFAIFSQDGRLDIDTDNSIVRFFLKEQRVALKYGYDVTGYGDVEWFSAGVFYLDSWDTKGFQATFTAKDEFYRLTQTKYQKGYIPAFGVVYTTRQMITDVLSDAGITEYSLTSKRLNYGEYLPLPVLSHMECLQLIANDNQGAFVQSDEGIIVFETRYFNLDNFSMKQVVVSTPQLPYSDIINLTKPFDAEYATWESDFFALDGSQKFLPESSPYINSGFVFNVFPSAFDTYYNTTLQFSQNTASDEINVGKISILFSEHNRISEVRVTIIADNAILYNTVQPLSGDSLNIIGNFKGVTRVNIDVVGSQKYQRMRVLGVAIDRISPIALTSEDVLGSTKKERLSECRDVISYNRTLMAVDGGEKKEFLTAEITPGRLTELSHNNRAFVNVSAVVNTLPGTITYFKSYAFFSYITVSSTQSSVEVTLSGSEREAARNTRNESNIVRLSETGTDAETDNPLTYITSETNAEWMADYYNNLHHYEIDVLGYPEIDAGDYIRFNDKEVVVLENVISTNGGAMRGKMKLRGRWKDGLADTEN